MKVRSPLVAAGLDIGCSSIRAAAFPVDRVESVRDRQTGQDITLTALLITPTGDILFGEAAKNSRLLHPDGFFTGDQVKLALGTDKTFAAPNGRTYSAKELFALLVGDALKNLSHTLEGRPFRLVATHPENFGELARADFVAAFAANGVQVDTVSEPVAAAVYLAELLAIRGEDQTNTLLIVDVGGGTTDLSLVEVSRKSVKVVATSGLPRVGGRNFTKALSIIFLDTSEARWGGRSGGKACTGGGGFFDDIAELHPQMFHDLWDSCERAKLTLSVANEATIACTAANGPHSLTVSRERFEHEVNHPSVGGPVLEIVEACKALLAEVGSRDVRVVLVGGGARVPVIANALREETGREVYLHPDAAHATVRGAAILARERLATDESAVPVSISGDALPTTGLELRCVAPYSIGLMVRRIGVDGPATLLVVVERNTPLPVSKVVRCFPHAPERIAVVVCQGEEGALRVHCMVLGDFVMPLVPPVTGTPDDRPLDFTFGYDASGRVQVDALDIVSGRTSTFAVCAPSSTATPTAA